MKTTFEIRTLGEVAEVNPRDVNGLAPDTLVTFVPMSAVDEERGLIANPETAHYRDVAKGYTPFKDGDVLFAKITPCMESGKCAIAKDLENGRGFGSTEFHVLRARDNVIPEGIYYFLRQEKVRKIAANSFTGTAGQQRVPKSVFDKLLIPIPPLPIQKRIAAVLEKADVAREKRRQANQLTGQFLQSAFLEMFGDPVTNPKGWDRIEAGKIFEIKLGKMLDEKRFTGKNLRPYLRNINVQWDDFDLSDIQEMDFTSGEFERNKLRRGDILVCEGGEVGRCAIWNEQIADCGYQKALHRLRVTNPVIDGRYFVNFMRLAATHGLLLRDTSQVTIAHFTAEKFREFKVLVPPLRDQQQFAALVEKVEGLRGKQRDSEKELENLFNSLMQRAFRGELVA